MSESTSIPEQKTSGLSKPTPDQVTIVYIWDMDETLILLKSLLNGTYAEAFKGLKNAQEGTEIGKMWEKLILDICDNHFFYEQIDNFNEPFLSALSQYDDGRDLSDYNFNQDGFGPPHDDTNKRKLGYRHRIIAHKYEEGLNSFSDQDIIKHWEELYNMTDKFTDRWLSSARAFLEECSTEKEDAHVVSSGSKYQYINLLVTSGSLIPSLVKCLLFRLDSLITHGNVYSSWEVGKLQCFRWIKERFDGPNVRFCAVGDGWEECGAAEFMQWPFMKIDLQPGCPYRFPGLTLKMVGYHLSALYGSPHPENDEE